MEQNTIYLVFITKFYGSNFQNLHNCGKFGHTTAIAAEMLLPKCLGRDDGTYLFLQ